MTRQPSSVAICARRSRGANALREQSWDSRVSQGASRWSRARHAAGASGALWHFASRERAPTVACLDIARPYVDFPGYGVAGGDELPLGRLETADDVGAAIAFLCSDDAAYITDEALNVSGGQTMV